MRGKASQSLWSQERWPADPTTFARLNRARDYIGAYYDRHVSLEEAAREACLSPFHFQRMFTRTFGQTPHEFLTHRRIEEARKLLLAGNQNVTEVCLAVGYESLTSFSARFRRSTGLSPSQLRREARRTFGGFACHWPLYYIPACFQGMYVGAL